MNLVNKFLSCVFVYFCLSRSCLYCFTLGSFVESRDRFPNNWYQNLAFYVGTMSINNVEKKVDKFDGRDFLLQSSHIENYLDLKKLYVPLSLKKPKDMEQEEWDELDGMAFAAIQLTLTNEVRHRDNLCIDDDSIRDV